MAIVEERFDSHALFRSFISRCGSHTSHIGATSLLGLFLLALCTSVFYGLILWTVYLALEPYVRRHWPRTLISWSRLLAGQWRDPIVGRDVLIGAALGVTWTLIGRVLDLIQGGIREPSPTWTDESLLLGTRDAIGAWLARGPHHLRDGLLFFPCCFCCGSLYGINGWQLPRLPCSSQCHLCFRETL